MVRPMPIVHISSVLSSPAALAIGLFVSATLLVGLCAKHARKVPKKQGSGTKDPNAPLPIKSPKQLIATISHKAMMVNSKKKSEREVGVGGKVNSTNSDGEDEENGVWQKAILMGEKCQPPEFSGVIYYDYCGNRISEMPKSPRATSMSPLRSFNFPAHKN
ncbi:DHFS-FPGS homolog B [Striga asiatica]|uniref:DHFS-FPGS homolog B n=1 Tax=Striga asiatica TaxID=4170 RepID=A0A5A7PGV9_STRAF|nr:DHFS-FPGS homolog B [Striga asiatica]